MRTEASESMILRKWPLFVAHFHFIWGFFFRRIFNHVSSFRLTPIIGEKYAPFPIFVVTTKMQSICAANCSFFIHKHLQLELHHCPTQHPRLHNLQLHQQHQVHKKAANAHQSRMGLEQSEKCAGSAHPQVTTPQTYNMPSCKPSAHRVNGF